MFFFSLCGLGLLLAVRRLLLGVTILELPVSLSKHFLSVARSQPTDLLVRAACHYLSLLQGLIGCLRRLFASSLLLRVAARRFGFLLLALGVSGRHGARFAVSCSHTLLFASLRGRGLVQRRIGSGLQS